MNENIINKDATAQNIHKLMKEFNLTVAEMQSIFGFKKPTAIYKWIHVLSTPTLDHLVVLAVLFGASINNIIAINEAALDKLALTYHEFKTPVKTIGLSNRKQLAIPSINTTATGRRIKRLMNGAGVTVQEAREIFGFKNPQAIYKWLRGLSMPSIDNLLILAAVLNVPVDEIIIVDVAIISSTTGRIISPQTNEPPMILSEMNHLSASSSVSRPYSDCNATYYGKKTEARR